MYPNSFVSYMKSFISREGRKNPIFQKVIKVNSTFLMYPSSFYINPVDTGRPLDVQNEIKVVQKRR